QVRSSALLPLSAAAVGAREAPTCLTHLPASQPGRESEVSLCIRSNSTGGSCVASVFRASLPFSLTSSSPFAPSVQAFESSQNTYLLYSPPHSAQDAACSPLLSPPLPSLSCMHTQASQRHPEIPYHLSALNAPSAKYNPATSQQTRRASSQQPA
ncbi:hypothetical protein IWX92DRAFT_429544, partial [Phyllosticta citricarpa]